MNLMPKQLFVLSLILVSGLLVSPQRRPKTVPNRVQVELSAQEIAKRLLPSIVLIVCDDGKNKVSQGSGFFIDRDKILTNYHVIDGMVRGKAKVATGKKSAGEWWIDSILRVDSANDLALLKIRTTLVESIGFEDDGGNVTRVPGKPIVINPGSEPLKLLPASEVSLGEKIYILSNPRGLTGTISQGIVSGGMRKVGGVDFLQIDAPISPGSSGGAVLNSRGEVIGIATASLKSGQNLNFAVPSSTIHAFLDRPSPNHVGRSFQVAAAEENSWKVRTSDSNPDLSEKEIPKVEPKEQPSTKPVDAMNYDEIVSDLVTTFRTASFRLSEKVQQRVTSFSISGCNVTFAKTWQLDGDVSRDAYFFDLRNAASFGGTEVSKDVESAVNLYFDKRMLQQTDHGAYEPSAEASMVKEVSIPIRISTINLFRIIRKFERLRTICSNSGGNGRPSLRESTDWLTNFIEGTVFTSSRGSTSRREQLRFSQCSMGFVERFRSGGVEILKTYRPDLRHLKRVETTKNTSGDWGVWLEFGRNFDVLNETFGYFGKKEYEKSDKVIVFFDTHEKARRVGGALGRVLELCSEDNEQPF